MPNTKDEPRRITNDDILLQDGLVEYEDPMDGAKKQVTVEVAKRIAKGNSIMRDKLIALGVLSEDDQEAEK